MSRILIVEDDPAIGKQLTEYLSKQDFTLELCTSFAAAKRIETERFDLAILDWNLKDGEGVDLLKMWRASGDTIPVLMLTARTEVIDRVVGLELGAQDYILKPFEPRELLARIRVHLKGKNSPGESTRLTLGGIEIDLSSRQCFFNSAEVLLTKMEFDLLHVLLKGAGKVFTRDELLNRVWGMDTSAETRTVDAHIFKLRQKFGEDRIETIRGLGYRMRKDK